MKDEQFNELLLSVRQAGEIRRKATLMSSEKQKGPIPGSTYDMTICVGYNSEGILVSVPDIARIALDSVYCDDNGFEGVPKEPGVYQCECEFYFIQGYYDGYPADGESDWGWKVTVKKKVELGPITNPT